MVTDSPTGEVASPAESASEPVSNGLDVEAGVDTIWKGLGIEEPAADEDTGAADDETGDPSEAAAAATKPPAAAEKQPAAPVPPTEKPVPPKSWEKNAHPIWESMSPEAQKYWQAREDGFLKTLEQGKADVGFAKEMRDVMTPYQPILTAQGITQPQAVQYLLNAHYQLTQGPNEARAAAYRKLGESLGLVKPGEVAEGAEPANPEMRELREEVRSVKSALTAREEAEQQQRLATTAREVEAFASDEAHPYFDEVSAEVVAFIKAGHTLADAYEKAVFANPVTRTRELARLQTEAEAKLKENARLDALKARKASETNIRGRETRTAPTEPRGKMFEDMPDMLRTIRERERSH